jgi:nucleoside-diphosphate-sugar epimerase
MFSNILLTGSNGFLGQYILKQFSDFSIKNLNRKNSDYNCDLSNTIPYFNETFDLIIHSAGKAHVIPKNKKETFSFYSTNVVGTKNLLHGLDQIDKPKYFLFISSVSVYGLNHGSEISEKNKLLANDSYGKSKIESEKIIKEWCDLHNVKLTIFRLPLIVGLNPPGNLGSMIKAIKLGYYFNINGGHAKKSMVLASDVAKFILPASKVGGIYNLTDGYHPSFCEFSSLVTSQLGLKNTFNMPIMLAKFVSFLGDISFGFMPIDSLKLSKLTNSLTFDDTHARNSFGWKPRQVLNYFSLGS